ncbi:MAG: MFS transporter [Bauldia sp.]
MTALPAPATLGVQSFFRRPLTIIVVGCTIAVLTFGPRSTTGFFMQPIIGSHGWNREIFAFAVAIQNLAWGIGQPFAGMLADRFGTARVLCVGVVLYAAGLALTTVASTPLQLDLTLGVLFGIGIAGSAFFLVLAAFARLLPERMRSLAFGLGTAAGSLGQFIFAPLAQGLIQANGWERTLLTFAAISLAVTVLSVVIRGKPAPTRAAGAKHADQSLPAALAEAFAHPSYRWLVAGFFVCGFHIAFITNHLPSYLNDIGIGSAWGATALALIGLFNIAGSIAVGMLANSYPRRWLLSTIYFSRAVAIALFVLAPPSIFSVIAFSVAMGLLWLSTVPATQGLVGVMFGTRYMATLFGFVFFSHQVGSFLGVWLGGRLYDTTGSYNAIWWASVALGVFAALVHVPIVERPVARLVAAE